jgi:hypothetical protein
MKRRRFPWLFLELKFPPRLGSPIRPHTFPALLSHSELLLMCCTKWRGAFKASKAVGADLAGLVVGAGVANGFCNKVVRPCLN